MVTFVVSLGAFAILVVTPVCYNIAAHFGLLRLLSALCNSRSISTTAATVPDCPLHSHQFSATVGFYLRILSTGSPLLGMWPPWREPIACLLWVPLGVPSLCTLLPLLCAGCYYIAVARVMQRAERVRILVSCTRGTCSRDQLSAEHSHTGRTLSPSTLMHSHSLPSCMNMSVSRLCIHTS